jgi:hypothetical protein
MKRLFIMLSLLLGQAYALDISPDSPLDTNMDLGKAAANTSATLNQIHPNEKFEQKQEAEREEELLESRYDVPDDAEEKEFNKNGN